ncbi:OmpA family protein [Pseudomonas sp. ZM23]|uniref:OmpA family protein n=1 Tax=Pseudomonas triclosanedens TaxID=2961893 RepID=A0ABY7A1K4_9PSED|nr:OmpA family protein [Pseudomonas triclosanedens]MCP8464409.1 OmpA family protein [Pseudomonas triclosanedens]MCP8471543.1 OmpA family protein [Pseudomonas triclosanedens]MCP8477645.1 OmpA family protein [Pseudomonas triclosanedens]WAI51102.1 OmpA family protein [Pseudomonas triclosanedens]
MRQPSLFLFAICASLPAWGLTFQSRLESAEWTVAGDQFECRLSQNVAGFGLGEFVWRAGEQPTFRLKPQQDWLGRGAATLLAAAPPWRPGQGDVNLGAVQVGSGDVPFNSTQQQAGRLLSGLLEGRTPEVRHRTRDGERLLVRLLPTRFAAGYAQFQDCSTKMLPVNFDQVRQSQIGFPGGGTELDALGRSKLDIILQYMKADPSVNRIELDGHSDNSGNRLTNRDTSRRRAIAVMEYLKSQGVPESQITVRFYGERYPLVKNSSEANRARNRRVTVNLSRGPVVEEEPVAPAAPSAPAPAAPQAASTEGAPPAAGSPATAPVPRG